MPTTYVILKQDEDKTWEELGKAEGGNDLSAVRAFLAASDGKYGAGVYRGVPQRSWPDDPHDLKPKISFV
jgi:hypothetical protein